MEEGSVGQHFPAVMAVNGSRKGPRVLEPLQCNALVEGRLHLCEDKGSLTWLQHSSTVYTFVAIQVSLSVEEYAIFHYYSNHGLRYAGPSSLAQLYY